MEISFLGFIQNSYRLASTTHCLTRCRLQVSQTFDRFYLHRGGQSVMRRRGKCSSISERDKD